MSSKNLMRGVYLSMLGSWFCWGCSSEKGASSTTRDPWMVSKSFAYGQEKSGSPGDDDGSESAEVDLPQEMAGAFLTCSYVTTKESGFSSSNDKAPVGCVVQIDRAKVVDDNFQFDIKLYSPKKNIEELDTRSAPQTSKWHGYGNLPMVGKSQHSLGTLIQDRRSRKTYGPLLFAVSKLNSSSIDATLSLVGNYLSAGVNNVETPDNPFRTNNLETPILPVSLCGGGKMRDRVDMNQYTDLVARGGRIVGEAFQTILNREIVPEIELRNTSKLTRDVGCFSPAKEAAPDNYNRAIRTQPVLDGAGCLFLQSKNGHVIYDKEAIEKYNIKREFLEVYVTNHLCP